MQTKKSRWKELKLIKTPEGKEKKIAQQYKKYIQVSSDNLKRNLNEQ